jgi:hypothetical protein
MNAVESLQEEPMAPKGVSPRKPFDRNHRFRGHGLLLQQRGPPPQRRRIHCPCRRGPCPRKTVDATKRPDGSRRFRGHGLLLEEHHPPTSGSATTGGYTRGTPLVGKPCGPPAAGQSPERRAWSAPTGAVSRPRTSPRVTNSVGAGHARLIVAATCPAPATVSGDRSCYAADRNPCGFCDCQCHVSRHMASMSSSAVHSSAFAASAGSA